MKDHELCELINDVTAVARLYANTQQLRQQISQLITPAIKVLQDRCETSDLILANGDKVIETLRKDVENLTKQVFCDHNWLFYDNQLDRNPGEERTFYLVCDKCKAKKPMMDANSGT